MESTHDSINLRRLVRRLQKTVNNEEWNQGSTEQDVWIKAMGTLQTVKYARALLKNVELYEENEGGSLDLGSVKEQLEAMTLKMQEATELVAPKPKPRPTLLAQLPRPPIPSPLSDKKAKEETTTESAPRPEAQPTISAEKLLLSPTELPQQKQPVSLTSNSLLPSNKSAASTSVSLSQGESKPTARSTAAGLQNSQALQQELSDQLAQMASQLKRNAQHFSDTLSKDNALVEETGEKLESNFGFMQKERIRLRDHSGKSWTTTWLVFGSIALVLTLFVLMVAIIRVTSR